MNKAEIGINLSADVAYDIAYCVLNHDIFLELGNCQLVYNHSRIVWMSMAWSRHLTEVSFEMLTTVEIFTDVTPNILLYDKTTTWMSLDPASNI